MNPVHPARIKTNDILFDKDNNKFKVLHNTERSGKFDISLLDIKENAVVDVFYDMHDYTGNGGDPLPPYYRKKFKKEQK